MRLLRGYQCPRVATRPAVIKAARGAALILGLVVASLPPALEGQVPPHEAWRTLTTENFRVTFPAGMETLGRRAAQRAEAAWDKLARVFLAPPSGRVELLLTDHTDFSNGFAQVRPSNRITIYARPPADDLGLGYFDEWLELVVTHELAHIFHLDRAGPAGRLLRSVFGRVPAPWPFFPGVGVPRWTTEGLATWYESYLTEAGRTHGTYHEMVVRTAALENRFERLDQASGDSPVWPGGNRAYAYGSLFFHYLLEKHGEDRMGAFAEAVAGQWVPYRLDAAGRRAFGAPLSQEWRWWAEAERVRAEATLEEARAVAPLTRPERITQGERVALFPRVSRDGGRLAWSASDGRTDPQLRVTDPEGHGPRTETRTNGVAAFDWLPDGRLLLAQLEMADPYRIHGDLHVSLPDGTLRRVTRGARLTQVSASPDGLWAVAVQEGGGTNGLVRVELDTGVLTPLVAPDLDVHWAYPAVSPDGRWIAASRWTPGAHLDVVILDGEGRVVARVTDDRAMDLAPAWSPDGRMLIWGSDRTGIPNVVAAEVDPAAGTVGPVLLATNVATGAAYPTVDPGGTWIYFSGYHADGWDVERVPFTPSAWPQAPPPSARFDASPRPSATQAAMADGEVRGYSAFPTVLPTYWEPLYREPIRTPTVRGGGHVIPGRQVTSGAWGLQTSGSDLVGRHAWSAFGRVFTSGGRAEAGGRYSWAGLGNPLVSVAASQFWDDDGPTLAQRGEDAPLDTLVVLERSRDVAAAVTFLRPRWRQSVSLTLSAGLSWERRELLEWDLTPSARYRLREPSSRLADLRATVSFSTARSHAFQVGAARGASATARARIRSHMALPDSARGVHGRDRSVDDVMAQFRLFQAVGGAGFASHVLALRVSGGAARGPGADLGHFEVGGATGLMESITGLALFGGAPLFFPVRGYPDAARYGRVAWSASAEYRFPVALVNRGLGAWPLHLDRVTGTLFADAGNAWGPELGIQGFQNPRRATLASAGAELGAELLALWLAPLHLRMGVGVPLVEGDGLVGYARLGLSF